ncbi:hypothetical protein PSACC_00476 [Paramicrosporidium saccamoebae]|uniref:Glycosyltransferase family 71 protein n=1 Tax=Paramicrosporidium saccamoebae TaxID=1246581 RepID=A0A2H9TPN0_9FUNG|nr:hypothetical protein PSACC_00476 [Paramicrosporidium saccamoebae]
MITLFAVWLIPLLGKSKQDGNVQYDIQRRTDLFRKYCTEEPLIGPHWDELNSELSKELDGSILTTALHFRLFKHLHQKYLKEELPQEPGFDVYQKLERKLFPWLVRDGDVRKIAPKNERGIVIATGQRYFPMAVHTIRSLRLWNCTLPVEIFHLGGDDLHQESRDFLARLPNVSLIDVGTVFNMTILDLKSWDIKPFAVLGSSFREVILVDADVVFTENPSVLFDYDEYKSTGTVFFRDRFFISRTADYAAWFEKIIPHPHSEKLQKTRMYRGETNYEQESGVVVIDKGRRLMGLLATCLLNCKKERGDIHANTHGEKETFWIGFEIAEEPYEYLEEQAGVVGVAVRLAQTGQTILCGHVAHFDKTGKLLWFNDGIVEDKKALIMNVGEFKHVENNGNWLGMCLAVNTLRQIPAEQSKMIDRMKELWVTNPAVQ